MSCFSCTLTNFILNNFILRAGVNKMLVKDIMSEDVHYIHVPGNRSHAMELMREKNVSGLPVVKNGTKKLVGIITRSDLVKNPDEEQLALIMTGIL